MNYEFKSKKNNLNSTFANLLEKNDVLLLIFEVK